MGESQAIDAPMFRSLVQSVRDYAIFILTADGHIASWNPGAQIIKQYTAEEALGKHFSMFYEPEAVAAGWPEEELRRSRANGRFEDEGWRVRKDGTRFWANVIISPLVDEAGAFRGYSKVTRDLSERRRQEELLRASEERLRLIVDGVRDHAMFLLDEHGTIVSWNAGATNVLGYDSKDIVGSEAAILYPSEEREAGRPQAELSGVTHAGTLHAEGWKVKADGSRIWAATAISALRSASGQLQGFVNVTRDLSEQRRLEDLEAEGKRVYEFIAMLSHELRNPLAPIKHAVRILEHPEGQQQIAKYTAMIGRQVSQLTRLVDDLMEVSRITTGKIKVERAHIEVNTMVQVATDSVRNILEARGHEIEVTFAPQPVFIDGDAVRLTQVLVNLLNNAATYTQPKGRIELAVHRIHTVVRIEVSDNGMGMSESLMQRAFEPFTQGERTLGRTEGGIGIGLTLVKRIVDLHGGSVVVASGGQGKGTRFTVTLPLIKNGQQPLAAVTSEARSAAGKVLVVDDNRDAAEALSELLRASGREVLCAFNGQEALDLAGQGGLSAVLLDIGLPDMSGYEVARRLRQLAAAQDVQIIATTGYGMQTDKDASAEAGFNAHLVKPVDYDEVLRLLDAA